jgi:hypothetical protein
VEPVELIARSLPQRQHRLVEAWTELHKEELISDWTLLQSGKRPAPIEPCARISKMKHPMYHVESFEQVGPYTLRITFDDGLSRVVNFEGILLGELFGPLRDPHEFARVKNPSGSANVSMAVRR